MGMRHLSSETCLSPIGQPFDTHLRRSHGEHRTREFLFQLFPPDTGTPRPGLASTVARYTCVRASPPIHQRIIDEGLQQGQERLTASTHHSQGMLAGKPKYTLDT